MSRDSWLKRLIWLRGSPAGGSGASYEKTVGPAPIISVADAKAKPAKSLIVGMEPIQDLHGYDSPWPAGGGKNLFNLDVVTPFNSNVTVIKTADTLTVTNNNVYVVNVFRDANSDMILPVTDGTYTLSIGEALTRNISIYGSSDGESYAWIANGIRAGNTTGSFTISGQTSIYLSYQVDSNGGTVTIKQLQLEKGSTPTAWTPYSNLCPISGRTGVTAYRTGVNVWDEEWEVGTLDNTTGLPMSGTTTIRSKNYIPIVGGATYYFKIANTWAMVFQYDANGDVISGKAFGTDSYNPKTLESNARFIKFRSSTAYGTTYNHDISINYPATDTDYYAYTGASYPVTWQTEAGTVYGGTVDVVSGVLTVTDAMIASYAGETLPSTWISDRDVYAAGTTPTIGAQVVYELAEPQTFTITQQQIQMLKGANVLFSDADDLTLTYIGTEPEEE